MTTIDSRKLRSYLELSPINWYNNAEAKSAFEYGFGLLNEYEAWGNLRDSDPKLHTLLKLKLAQGAYPQPGDQMLYFWGNVGKYALPNAVPIDQARIGQLYHDALQEAFSRLAPQSSMDRFCGMVFGPEQYTRLSMLYLRSNSGTTPNFAEEFSIISGIVNHRGEEGVEIMQRMANHCARYD